MVIVDVFESDSCLVLHTIKYTPKGTDSVSFVFSQFTLSEYFEKVLTAGPRRKLPDHLPESQLLLSSNIRSMIPWKTSIIQD